MKAAFITGGATGIGKATVEKFIREGVKVAFLDMNEEGGLALRSRYGPSEVVFFPGDVRSISCLRCALEQTVTLFGKLDILFANAGISRPNTILDITEAEWDLIMDTNLKGVVFTLREGIPYLIANGGGAIVLMGSDQCFVGKRFQFAYGASKGAIGQITKSLALDLAEYNIRVNAVCPGTIRTPLSEAAVKRWADWEFDGNVQKAWQVEASRYPLRRVGTPEEVAELVYFLSTDRSSFMTGSLLPIDGGLTAA